ncbi:DUF2911 domain-containing protein [Parvicella tangerina]|nr:DUF2911 domain-containing protein [Parvicella tangerina]
MKILKLTFTLILSGFIFGATAQELPQASPRGKIEQTVGLTNISIDYSRPSVKGRKIFGEVVPFNEIWRLGANASTKITIDQYLKFGDQILKPGTYSMFAYPSEKKWEIHFNTVVEQWGTSEYDETKNAVSVVAKTQEAPLKESLEISIENLTINSGSIVIRWEKTMIELPFIVNTKELAEKNISNAIEKGEDLNKVYYNAAKYYLTAKDYEQALTFIEKSIDEKSAHNNLFYKARILEAKGDTKAAIKFAEKALDHAKNNNEEGWASYIQKSIDEWSK